MADTTTISDLTEKSVLADTDKLLVEDINGVGQALLGSAVTDKINGALANYPILSELTSSIDPETLTKSGFYFVTQNNNKMPVATGLRGELLVRYIADGIRQLVFFERSGTIYSKTQWSGTWGNWQKLVTESEISNYKKIETREVTATVDVNGNINTPLTELFSIVSVSGSNKMYIPFKYSTYWVLYCMNVGGSKVASGTELTVTIKYFQN